MEQLEGGDKSYTKITEMVIKDVPALFLKYFEKHDKKIFKITIMEDNKRFSVIVIDDGKDEKKEFDKESDLVKFLGKYKEKTEFMVKYLGSRSKSVKKSSGEGAAPKKKSKKASKKSSTKTTTTSSKKTKTEKKSSNKK